MPSDMRARPRARGSAPPRTAAPAPAASAPRAQAAAARAAPREDPDADVDADTIFEDEADSALRYAGVEAGMDAGVEAGMDAGLESSQEIELSVDASGVVGEAADSVDEPAEPPTHGGPEQGRATPRPRTPSAYPFPLAPPPPAMTGMPMDPNAAYPVAYPTYAPPPGHMPSAPMPGPLGTGPMHVTSSYPTYTGPIPYLVQPVMAAPHAMRWVLAIALAMIATTAIGVGIGWLLFARSRDGQHGAGAGPAGAAPTAAAGPVEGAASGAPASAPSHAIAVDVAVLEHRVLAPVTSPARGEVSLSTVQTARPVHKGDKLFEVRRRREPAPEAAQLAARVAELEKLAAHDPLYESFLARARDDYKRAQRSDLSASIRASADGLAEPRASRGDHVDLGDTLAVVTDPATWIARAPLQAGVTPEWTCAISDGTSRAPCRIEQLSAREITASAHASDAPWLGAERKPRLLLEAPRAR
jgi:hypothetical protein